MARSETITKLAMSLVKAQAEMGNATKGSTNPFFKSSYADLNSIREAVLPVLNKHGIAALQPTVVMEGKNYVETMLLHESGEFLSSMTEIKVSKINDAQAEGSGISYARRYGLQSLVNIGAADDDGEKTMGRTAAPVKAATTDTTTTTAPKRTAASFAKKTTTTTVKAPETTVAVASANVTVSNGNGTAAASEWEN